MWMWMKCSLSRRGLVMAGITFPSNPSTPLIINRHSNKDYIPSSAQSSRSEKVRRSDPLGRSALVRGTDKRSADGQLPFLCVLLSRPHPREWHIPRNQSPEGCRNRRSQDLNWSYYASTQPYSADNGWYSALPFAPIRLRVLGYRRHQL